eukprot:4871613-Amphidinium_carterae.1
MLITYSISVQDISVLETVYPGRSCGRLTRALAAYAWFCQAMFLPSIFAACVAVLIANSHDALSIVMNTLAVTFLLEVDDMLYDAVLTEEEKYVYQSGHGSVWSTCVEGKTAICIYSWHTRALK